MSSAKPTPRYVQRIPAPNIHLVGGATAEAQVIPIRRVTPAFVPVIETPAAPAAAPRRVTRFVPVERRPWLVMLVPPTPASATRSFNLARWQAQLATAALVVMMVMSGGVMAALVGAVDVEDVFGSFAINGKMNRAKQQAQQYNIQSVPTVVVDGKFITGSERVGTHAQLPPAVEELVNKARAERTKSSAK